MPKRILQDVVTSSSPRPRTNIRKSDNIKQRNEDSTIDVRMPSANRINRNINDHDSKGVGFSRFAIWGVAIFAVLFLLFVLLQFFSGTVVEVVPLQKNITLNEDFIATKDAGEGKLPFKLVVLESSLSGVVTATEEKNIERKSSGNIVIYNKYSSKSQKLRKRTRFEAPDGKYYLIDKSVVVPGTTVQNGETIPGSVEVTVYAEFSGKEYDIGLTDFTVPGFKKEDPLRFEKFYARSKTPIENGFSGIEKLASSEDIAKGKEELQNSLKETLLVQARSQVPKDFILYDDAVFFSFKNISNQGETKKDMINITEEGILYGVLFNKSELSKHIAASTVVAYDGSDVSVQDLEELKFNVINREGFNSKEDSKLKFTISGPALIVWDINETLLARDLAGTSKVDFENTIGEYSNIQTATATLRPFWKKVFPENSEDIIIRKIDPERNSSR